MRLLVQCDWRGNIRQLLHVVQQAKILATGNVVYVQDLPNEVYQGLRCHQGQSCRDPADLAGVQRAHIVEVLQREGGNKARAARVLGINRRSLYRLLSKYTIQCHEIRPESADG